jgi:hypothetical protein
LGIGDLGMGPIPNPQSPIPIIDSNNFQQIFINEFVFISLSTSYYNN